MISQSSFKAKMVAATALILLFGSGVVVGLALDQTANASTLEEVRPDARPEREGARPEREGARHPMIVDRVGLSVVQKATVDSLVSFHRQRMSDLNTDFRPRYRAVIGDLRVEIRQVLTDDQRLRYDTLLAEYEEEHAARRRNNSRK